MKISGDVVPLVPPIYSPFKMERTVCSDPKVARGGVVGLMRTFLHADRSCPKLKQELLDVPMFSDLDNLYVRLPVTDLADYKAIRRAVWEEDVNWGLPGFYDVGSPAYCMSRMARVVRDSICSTYRLDPVDIRTGIYIRYLPDGLPVEVIHRFQTCVSTARRDVEDVDPEPVKFSVQFVRRRSPIFNGYSQIAHHENALAEATADLDGAIGPSVRLRPDLKDGDYQLSGTSLREALWTPSRHANVEMLRSDLLSKLNEVIDEELRFMRHAFDYSKSLLYAATIGIRYQDGRPVQMRVWFTSTNVKDGPPQMSSWNDAVSTQDKFAQWMRQVKPLTSP
jgi:hypothetical protein